jgi:hypothetical protein
MTHSLVPGLAPVALLAAALLTSMGLVACGKDSQGGSHPATSLAITGLTPGRWTWVDFPDSSCGDGSPTGIAVQPGSGDLLVFLDGGGACWSYETCFTSQLAATKGPFGADQFHLRSLFFGGSVLDRTAPESPFAASTLVYVPYCTADVHSGSRVTTYDDGHGNSAAVHHVGHTNLQAFVRRLAATFPTPTRVVLAGSSAGGFGALTAFADVRAAWHGAPAFLVDDSGPPVPGITPSQRDAFFASWGLGAASDELCPGCRTDLTAIYGALAARFPDDRMALASSTADATISFFFSLSEPAFTAALTTVTSKTLPPLAPWRSFVVEGTSHTMLGNVASHSAGGVALAAFLEQMVSADPAWQSVGP